MREDMKKKILPSLKQGKVLRGCKTIPFPINNLMTEPRFTPISKPEMLDNRFFDRSATLRSGGSGNKSISWLLGKVSCNLSTPHYHVQKFCFLATVCIFYMMPLIAKFSHFGKFSFGKLDCTLEFSTLQSFSYWGQDSYFGISLFISVFDFSFGDRFRFSVLIRSEIQVVYISPSEV